MPTSFRGGGGVGRGRGGRPFFGGGRGAAAAAAAAATAPFPSSSSKSFYKAKCAENQPLVDVLAEKMGSVNPASQYLYALQKAMKELVKEKEPIASYEAALKVKGIGQHLAHMMFPAVPSADEGGGGGQRQRKKNKRNGADSGDGTSPSSSSIASSAATNATSASNVNAKKRRKTAKAKAPPGEASSAAAQQTSTKKEVAYKRAVERSLAWQASTRSTSTSTSSPLTWRVVLLIDNREQKQELMRGQCSMVGIPCEIRQLPVGDMTWIVQGFERGAGGGSGGDGNRLTINTDKPVVELLVGTIIERKTLLDLESSIHGTRYDEQRMRLKESGLFQLVLLIEGDLSKVGDNPRLNKCHTALWETRLHMGFQAIQTKSMDETVLTLKRLHRRILQRTFPDAFYEEALPAFSVPDASGMHRQRQRQQLQQSPRQSPSDIDGQRRRQRRRLQSLTDMTFDTVPTCPEGSERFVSYEELKAKVELDREQARMRIGAIHAAMLKQIPTVESKKVLAITKVYPTPNSLLGAYHSLRSEDEPTKAGLVKDFYTQDPDQSTRKCTIGPGSSRNLYIAYGMMGPDEAAASASDSDSDNANDDDDGGGGGVAAAAACMGMALSQDSATSIRSANSRGSTANNRAAAPAGKLNKNCRTSLSTLEESDAGDILPSSPDDILDGGAAPGNVSRMPPQRSSRGDEATDDPWTTRTGPGGTASCGDTKRKSTTAGSTAAYLDASFESASEVDNGTPKKPAARNLSNRSKPTAKASSGAAGSATNRDSFLSSGSSSDAASSSTPANENDANNNMRGRSDREVPAAAPAAAARKPDVLEINSSSSSDDDVDDDLLLGSHGLGTTISKKKNPPPGGDKTRRGDGRKKPPPPSRNTEVIEIDDDDDDD